MRTRAGTRTLKKIFHEARIPVRERSRIPVLADAEGRVLWAAGVARAADAAPPAGGPALTITITDA
jgi:tRNA(Ile)-lysidine synthase